MHEIKTFVIDDCSVFPSVHYLYFLIFTFLVFVNDATTITSTITIRL